MENFFVIPCYNEKERIIDVIKRINALDIHKKIVVVDDGSFDGSQQAIESNFNDVLLLRHEINLGKGAALKTGCEASIKLGAEIIILMDADGQHPPEVIPEMLEKIEKEKLDIVFASRKMDAQKMPVILYFGNKFLTSVTNFFSGTSISDSQSGLKAFKSSAYEKLCWKSSDYSAESEMIINAGKNNLKYGETFIDTIYNDKYKGTTPFDGIKVLINIFKNI